MQSPGDTRAAGRHRWPLERTCALGHRDLAGWLVYVLGSSPEDRCGPGDAATTET